MEYATQLLNYPQKTITDFVIGTLDSTVTECMDVMEKSLLESSVFEDIPKEDIAKGVDLLRSRFSKKIEPICSKLERFMLEVIFKVPDHVLLPEDAAQRTKHSEKEHKKILREIESIKSDIQMEKYKKVVFRGKLKEATETHENLKAAALEIETTSQKVLRENKTMDIKENSEFILAKFERCRAQLKDLQESAPPTETKDTNKLYRPKENELFKTN